MPVDASSLWPAVCGIVWLCSVREVSDGGLSLFVPVRTSKSSSPSLFVFKLFGDLPKAIRPCILSFMEFLGKGEKNTGKSP